MDRGLRAGIAQGNTYGIDRWVAPLGSMASARRSRKFLAAAIGALDRAQIKSERYGGHYQQYHHKNERVAIGMQSGFAAAQRTDCICCEKRLMARYCTPCMRVMSNTVELVKSKVVL